MRLDHLLSKEKVTEDVTGLRSITRTLMDMLYDFECLIQNRILNAVFSRKTNLCGGVAQLGEHLPCKQGVRSSILLISTTVSAN